MSRLFVLATILLRCVNSSDLRMNVVEDDFHQQSVLVDKNKYPDNIASEIAYFPSPDDDGTFIEVYMGTEDYQDPDLDASVPEGASVFFKKDPKYYLYTTKNRNNPVKLYIKKDNGEGSRYFNRDAPVKILCHGYQSSYTKPFPVRLMDKYLDSVEDVNVILVDWKDLASSWFYNTAAKNTMYVGKVINWLVQRLVNDGFTDLSKIHFIGHSLGAHVGGSLGYYLSTTDSSGSKILRITGLDPAGPSFCSDDIKRLSSEDASYVDIIHTAIGKDCEEDPSGIANALLFQTFGLNMSIGHSDFYPNGGSGQPGCSFPESTNLGCSHSRAYHLLEESIQTEIGFHACKCEKWFDYENGNCLCEDKVLMGENCPITAEGDFFLKTGPKHPFAQLV